MNFEWIKIIINKTSHASQAQVYRLQALNCGVTRYYQKVGLHDPVIQLSANEFSLNKESANLIVSSNTCWAMKRDVGKIKESMNKINTCVITLWFSYFFMKIVYPTLVEALGLSSVLDSSTSIGIWWYFWEPVILYRLTIFCQNCATCSIIHAGLRVHYPDNQPHGV